MGTKFSSFNPLQAGKESVMRRNLLAALVAVGMVLGLVSAALAMPAFVQQGVIPAGVGYAYVYRNLSRAELANAFADPAAMTKISRVSGEVMLQQMQQANPGLALPFEGTAGAARAIATDPDFQVVACRDGMFDGSNGTTLTNKSASVFGAHQRKCYVGETVLTYKGVVLMSMMCLNGRITWTTPLPVTPVAKFGRCPNGLSITLNYWLLEALPQDRQQQALGLVGNELAADSQWATRADAYRHDRFSRGMGDWLIEKFQDREPVNASAPINAVDPTNTRIRRPLGPLDVQMGSGIKEIVQVDPTHQIIEAIIPPVPGYKILSPPASGGLHRIWLLPEEWFLNPREKNPCRKDLHALVTKRGDVPLRR